METMHARLKKETETVQAYRVLIVDDHPYARKAIRSLLEEDPAFTVAGEAESGEEAIRLCGELGPDVVLMDIRMPGMSGLEATRQLKRLYPQLRIVMLTVSDAAEDLFTALQFGAQGYLLKNMKPEEWCGYLHALLDEDAEGSRAIADRLIRQFRERPQDVFARAERGRDDSGEGVPGDEAGERLPEERAGRFPPVDGPGRRPLMGETGQRMTVDGTRQHPAKGETWQRPEESGAAYAGDPGFADLSPDALTNREREIAAFIAQGRTNREISRQLNISEHTVKNHIKNMLHKLSLDNRVGLAAYAIRNGLSYIRHKNSEK